MLCKKCHVVCVALLWGLHVFACRADFAGTGSCSSNLQSLDFTLPSSTACGWRCSGVLYIHTPDSKPTTAAAAGRGGRATAARAALPTLSAADAAHRLAAADDITCMYGAPYPLVIFISGFLAAAADYFDYSRHLASWGFAVLQYDFNLLAAGRNGLTHTDVAEVGFLPHFLDVLTAAASHPTSPLYGKLDFNNMGAAGHSRGAKIAALHFAGNSPSIRAAFLVDPVDGTTATASQPGYPSAVEALRGRSKLLGITGAGRIGPCNGAPYATGNWSSFWGVAAAGSWLELVPDAGHLQFADISSILDLLCCRGCTGLLSHKEGIELAKVPLTTWFDQQLRPTPSTAGLKLSMSYSRGANSVESRSGVPSSGSNDGSRSSSGIGAVARARHRRDQASSSSSSSSSSSFKDWVCSEEADGKISFIVKGLGHVCGPAAASAAAV